MLEQIIRRADFHIEDGEVTPRFGPLMNDSQIKNLFDKLDRHANDLYKERLRAGLEPILEALKITLYSNSFFSLSDMNLEGWFLESFASILDVNQIRIQVAIFSREKEIAEDDILFPKEIKN